MKNSLYLGVLAMTCLGLGAANGQPPGSLPPPDAGWQASRAGHDTGPEAPATLGPPGTQTGAADEQRPVRPYPPLTTALLNDYLAYLRPAGCCCGVGRDGIIGSEAYLRSGVSFSVGGGVLGRVLDPGFMIEGGVRSVFFRPRADWAWTVDFGISSVWYHASGTQPINLLNTDGTTTGVTPSGLNQTYVHLALGNEYYLMGDADPLDCGCKWRAGWDAGGKLGTEKLELRETRHRTDVVGGPMAAIHTDVEMPYGQAIFQAGLRLEYDYIESDVLQSQNNTNLSQLNLLFSAGVRY